jgi:hypothetical protein
LGDANHHSHYNDTDNLKALLFQLSKKTHIITTDGGKQELYITFLGD